MCAFLMLLSLFALHLVPVSVKALFKRHVCFIGVYNVFRQAIPHRYCTEIEQAFLQVQIVMLFVDLILLSSCFPDNILFISIISLNFLLYLSVGQLRLFNLSWHVLSLKPGISLVTLLWTFSDATRSFFKYGAQTWFLYCRWGRTKPLYI